MRHLAPSSVRQFLKSHRRLVTILASILLILLVAGAYGLWSIFQWQSYERRSDQSLGSIHSELDKALKLEVKDDQNHAKKLAAFDNIAAKVGQFRRDCLPASLLTWQTSFEGARKLKENCDRVTSSLEKLQGSLDKVTSYLRDEKETVDIIAPLGGDVESDETKWQETYSSWQQAAQKLSEAKVGNEFKPAYDVLKERLSTVVAAWGELLTSHEAKDRTRFEKAADELMKTYGGFKVAADDTDGVFKALEDSLKRTYQDTF